MADSTETRALLLQINATTELLRSQLTAAEQATAAFQSATQGHLDKVDDRFEVLGKGIEKLEGPLERLKHLGELAIGALIGESLLEAGHKALEFAGNIEFVSEQIGTSTDFLQKYRYAASQFGVAAGEADEGLGKFSRSVGQAANGSQKLVQLFDSLGVKVRDSAGNVRSVEAVYLDTADAIAKLPDPAQKAADTMTLMGKQSIGLVPLLSEGARGFNDLAAAAEQLGIVLSPELIEHSEQVNHKLSALKQVVDAQMASAIAQNATAISQLATELVGAAGAVAKFLGGHPERALAILGGLAGLRAGGPLGGAVGAAGGYLWGREIEKGEDDANQDVGFRRQQLARARSDYHATDPNEYGVSSAPGLRQSAQEEYQRQLNLMQTALRAPKKAHERNLGSTGAGGTNDGGDLDLSKEQEAIADLERAKKTATGSALTAINEELTERRRTLGFLKLGMSAEEATTLASKQGSVDRKGESDATRAARKAEQDRLKTIEDELAFRQEQSKLQKSILDGAKASTSNDAKRDALQREIINVEADTLAAQIADRRDKVTGDPAASSARKSAAVANAKTLLNLNEQDRQQKLQNVDLSRAGQVQKDAADKAALQLQGQITLLGLDDQLALTRKERLKYELKLLDYQEQAAKAAQQAIIDSKDPKVTDAQRAAAQTTIAQIDAQHGANTAIISQRNESPLASYRDQLRSAVGDTNDALQGLEVNAFKGLEDGLVGVIDGTKSVGQAFKEMAASILSDLARIEIEKAIVGAIGGGGGGGGLLSFIGIGKHADGGRIAGPGGPRSDVIPALLSNGEYVINAPAAARFGPLLDAINGNRLPRFADGGIVGPIRAPRVPSLAGAGSGQVVHQHFDLRGAVVTEKLYNDMNSIAKAHADDAAVRGASGGAQLAQQQATRNARYSLAG